VAYRFDHFEDISKMLNTNVGYMYSMDNKCGRRVKLYQILWVYYFETFCTFCFSCKLA